MSTGQEHAGRDVGAVVRSVWGARAVFRPRPAIDGAAHGVVVRHLVACPSDRWPVLAFVTVTDSATVTGRAVEVRRLRNTSSGNPRWLLVFADGRRFQTAPNASVGFEVIPGRLEGADAVTLTLDSRGRAVDVVVTS